MMCMKRNNFTQEGSEYDILINDCKTLIAILFSRHSRDPITQSKLLQSVVRQRRSNLVLTINDHATKYITSQVDAFWYALRDLLRNR